MKFDKILEVGGHSLTKHYIQSLSKEDRHALIDPIFNLLRTTEFIYPDDETAIKKSWAKIKDHVPDLSTNSIYNNSSLATDICKYFCHSFYKATEPGKPTMVDNFYDDMKLKRIIENRLGLDWLDPDEAADGTIRPGVNEAFNLSFKMIVFQGQRSMRFVNGTSMFKPTIAKYMCMKYSQEGDVVGDYSAGFGGRLLGAMSCGRKYIATDPLTVPELEKMAAYYNFDNYKLIHSGSEEYRGEENSVDLYYSSPPYYDQESYSENCSQAYNRGEDYFYNEYWRKTLQNVKHMLKSGKWFGLNVKNFPKMLEMAQEEFGEVVETVALRTVKSHLTKTKDSDDVKNEYIYMFKNMK